MKLVDKTQFKSRPETGAARPAPIPHKAAPRSILAIAREQVEQELGPRPTWSPEDEATDFIRDMAQRWKEFGLAGCVQQQPAERWLEKMRVLNAARRWDRAVSDRCKALGAVHTLEGGL